MQPRSLGDKEFRRCTADREAKVVIANNAVANDVITLLEVGHLGANLHHFTRPLVAGNDWVAKWNDVAAFEQLNVRVANANCTRCNQYLIISDVRN